MAKSLTLSDLINHITVDASDRILIGDTASDAVGAEAGSVTISTGDSGQTSPNANADELIIENDTNAGITIATPNTAIGSIFFADAAGDSQGKIEYNHSTDNMVFSRNGGEALTLSSQATFHAAPIISTNFPILYLDDKNSTAITDAGGTIVFRDSSFTTFARFGVPGSNGVLVIDNKNNASTVFYTNDTDRGRFTGSGQFLVGTSVALGVDAGSVTISTGDSGVTAALTNADDLIVEGSGDTGISILSPDLNLAAIKLGTPSDTGGAHFKWDYTNLTASIGSINASAKTSIVYGNGTPGILLDNSGRIVTGDGTSDALGVDDGSITISTGNSGVTSPATQADDLIIEGSATSGLTIATPNTNDCRIHFADPQAANAGFINYTHTSDLMTFGTGTSTRFRIESDGTLSVPAGTYENLVTADDDIPNRKWVEDNYGAAAGDPITRYYATSTSNQTIGTTATTSAATQSLGTITIPTSGYFTLENIVTQIAAGASASIIYHGLKVNSVVYVFGHYSDGAVLEYHAATVNASTTDIQYGIMGTGQPTGRMPKPVIDIAESGMATGSQTVEFVTWAGTSTATLQGATKTTRIAVSMVDTT